MAQGPRIFIVWTRTRTRASRGLTPHILERDWILYQSTNAPVLDTCPYWSVTLTRFICQPWNLQRHYYMISTIDSRK
jgi:hypothetical protein